MTLARAARRPDGVRSFLASRTIELPEGEPADPSEAQTVHEGLNPSNRVDKRRGLGGKQQYSGAKVAAEVIASLGV